MLRLPCLTVSKSVGQLSLLEEGLQSVQIHNKMGEASLDFTAVESTEDLVEIKRALVVLQRADPAAFNSAARQLIPAILVVKRQQLEDEKIEFVFLTCFLCHFVCLASIFSGVILCQVPTD